LFFGPGRLLYAGPLGAARRHAHHTLQLVLALEGTVVLEDARGATHTCQAAVVPPDVPHAVVEGCASAVLLHVAPEDAAGRALLALGLRTQGVAEWARAGAPLAGLRVRSLPSRWDEAEALAAQLLRALGTEHARPPPRHPAITRLLRELPAALEGDVRTPALAARVGLSAGRLSHLFSAEVGLPLRPYVRWLRLQQAAALLGTGASLTTAAHAAGFTDSAHLSHTFRRTFGLTPAALAAGVQWVAPPAPWPFNRMEREGSPRVQR
jgi:AraC-like DNA-binding protein